MRLPEYETSATCLVALRTTSRPARFVTGDPNFREPPTLKGRRILLLGIRVNSVYMEIVGPRQRSLPRPEA